MGQLQVCTGNNMLLTHTSLFFLQHFGEPTKAEKTAFTRVLQGHIALDTLVFPEGTTGFIMSVQSIFSSSSMTYCKILESDAMARRPLWSEGLGKLDIHDH